SVVWSLQRNTSVEAEELKGVLVKLSGKSQKQGKPPTAGTLLSGLFVLIRIIDFLDLVNDDPKKIKKIRASIKKLLQSTA
ncbi:MAG: hypothetical protein LBJ00_01700, partial [Planctomycetaceae bacterium]|nr:hypothetical protein [Planctomycetaceae bacterium]